MLQSGRVDIRRDGDGGVRPAGRRDGRRGGTTARRRAGVPDGQRHAQPHHRRDREGAPRARQPVCRPVRPDAAAHAAARRDRSRGDGARGRRRPDRDDRWRLGDRRRQGGAALPRPTTSAPPRRLDRYRPVKGPDGAVGPPPCKAALGAAGHGADHVVGRRVQRHRRRHRRAAPGQGAVPPSAGSSRARSCSTRRSPCTRPNGCGSSTGIRAVDHCVEGICSGEANPYADAQALHGLALLAAACRGSRPIPAISRPGSIARSARGCRWGRSPAACRWVPATASATCSARCSTSRTAIRRASCCRR